MTCFHPITAFKTKSGEVVFNELKRHGDTQTFQIPCGQCVGCKLERSRQWGARCMHESKMHAQNSSITLTFNEENKPPRGNLDHTYFQLFIKRLRKNTGANIRYYMGGEYGDKLERPHFHACIFGWNFPDRLYFKRTDAGSTIYTSAQLQKLWPYGFSSVGELTFESAAYIARYCMKKITGDLAKEHYKREDENGVYWLTPEYAKMSLKPAIGRTWLEQYMGDVYNHDHMIINGVPTRPPKYYDKILKRTDPAKLEAIKEKRETDLAQIPLEERHWRRLEAIEEFQKARIKSLLRNKI